MAIASGINEAVDAWVSANYILGGATAADPKDTVGTIDLGGGSVQVCPTSTTHTPAPTPTRHLSSSPAPPLSVSLRRTRLARKPKRAGVCR